MEGEDRQAERSDAPAAKLGAAGVGAQALRHDTRANLQPGDGLGVGAADSTLPLPFCGPAPTLMLTPTTLAFSTYVIQMGDTPASVAEKFGVTVDELRQLNAANLELFVVGAQLTVPWTPVSEPVVTTAQCGTTTSVPPSTAVVAEVVGGATTTTMYGQEAPPASTVDIYGSGGTTTSMG